MLTCWPVSSVTITLSALIPTTCSGIVGASAATTVSDAEPLAEAEACLIAAITELLMLRKAKDPFAVVMSWEMTRVPCRFWRRPVAGAGARSWTRTNANGLSTLASKRPFLLTSK